MENIVLALLKELKRAYESKIGACTYTRYGAGANETCVNRWVEQLNDPYFNARFSGIVLHQYKDFVNFHYTRFNSATDENGNRISPDRYFKVYNGLYMECRGTVLDVRHERVALLPFRKFMNLNECEETSTENIRKRLDTAKVVEFSDKLDGSMISAGISGNAVIMSGSSANDPSASVQLRRAYEYAENNKDYERMLYDNPGETHIFEYVSRLYDPHVVSYDIDEEMFLVGIRDKDTGVEASYADVKKRAESYNVPCMRIFDRTFDETLLALDDKKATEAEGFVMNIDGFKVKIKYNDYVQMHRALTALVSPKSAIKAAADGTEDDVMSKLPEDGRKIFREYCDDITDCVSRITEKTEEYHEMIKDRDRRDAMKYIDTEIPGIYRTLVRNRYLGQPLNILRERSGRYRTMEELKDMAAGQTDGTK